LVKKVVSFYFFKNFLSLFVSSYTLKLF